jgi:hypothetical protein
MKLMYEPGSYSVNISTERSVTSIRDSFYSVPPSRRTCGRQSTTSPDAGERSQSDTWAGVRGRASICRSRGAA